MECRIQIREQRDGHTATVAGHLTASHIPDLLAVCGEISTALRVDLTDILSTDPIAVDALRRLRDGGAELVGVPRYIQLKLDSLDHTPRGL